MSNPKCQHRIDYENEMYYWPNDEPCLMCWAEKARPVVDAALKLLEHEDKMSLRATEALEPEWCALLTEESIIEEELYDTCRKYKGE